MQTGAALLSLNAAVGSIVATGTLLGSTIRRVFVRPSHQCRGYGALVMHALEKEALRRGIRRVDLFASLPSKRFYDLLGYTMEREAYIPVRNNKRLDYYSMVNNLVEASGESFSTSPGRDRPPRETGISP